MEMICKHCKKDINVETENKHNSKLKRDILFYKKGTVCPNCNMKLYGIVPNTSIKKKTTS